LAAAAGGLVRLPRQIPSRVAMEMALTGDFMDADRALSLGLINQVAPAGEALAQAKALAAKIAENGPLAVKRSKQVIKESIDWSQDEMFEKQQAIVNPVFSSEDAIEGATAFAEKRKPNWNGRYAKFSKTTRQCRVFFYLGYEYAFNWICTGLFVVVRVCVT
jgi:enoyl-CoA hydratase